MALDVGAGKIYWQDRGAGVAVKRADVDGSNVEELVTTDVFVPFGIAVDPIGGKVYWTDANPAGNWIRRANLDGSSVETLIAGLGFPRGIDLDIAAGKMYWTNMQDARIRRANLDGSNEELAVIGQGDLWGVTLDVPNGKIYWTVRGGGIGGNSGQIWRANLDGSLTQVVVNIPGGDPVAVVLDVTGGKLYWTDYLKNEIARASLDGSNIETVVASTAPEAPYQPYGIDIQFTACGDGVVEGAEDCDDVGVTATCDADCTFAQCGDATLNTLAGEVCDDGGESATCDTNCTLSGCGDGTLNTTAGEECDDGNTYSGDGCDAYCYLEPDASDAEMRVYPIRSAPLGSPVGTLGDPVMPSFNAALGCWELQVPGGVEVDIDLQAFGWGGATCLYDDGENGPTPVPCPLGAIAGAVDSAGYDNGIGTPLNPKGWPASPGDGAYQADKACGGGGSGLPCSDPFDVLCNFQGFCSYNPNWVMSYDVAYIPVIVTNSLDYGWAVAAEEPFNDYDIDDSVKTFGGLILEVPNSAAGIYVIAFDPDPSKTYMAYGDGAPIPGVTLTPACITIIENAGACCSGTNCSMVAAADCEASGGTFFGFQSTCDTPDGDGDGLRNECDGCPNDGNKVDPGICGCGVDDNADADGDAVPDCIDQCDGVDDAVFAPGCAGAIPTVSAWGLVVMTLLLLVGVKVAFSARRRRQT